jgi:hypothetical protein
MHVQQIHRAPCGGFQAAANADRPLVQPAESGWAPISAGRRRVVTLFVYGPNGEPVWYGAPATHVVAYGADGVPHFSGDLYQTRGSWQGGPFDPAAFTGIKVGTISLSPLANGSLKIDYTVARSRFPKWWCGNLAQYPTAATMSVPSAC